MSIDTRYTADDGVKWENYHDAVISWVNGGNNPGAPPAGYIKSYRVRHPRAPLTSDYPRVEEAWRNRHATACNSDTEDCEGPAQRATAPDTGVFFPQDAWSSLLNHQAMMTHQVGELASRAAIPTAPRAMVHFQPQNYGVHPKFYGPKGGPVAAKGWKRSQVAKAMRKGKGKGRKDKSVWRARLDAIKAESAGGAGSSKVVGERAVTPSPEEIEEGETSTENFVPEDVFMADYTNFKDEDDDGAAGSLFSEGDNTVIVAAA
ncbi:hypothetical protein C8R45DRAFT_942658 [Mycena sanguinolenta]|nr:hypothetical protein C8R45DRAFT_942658 [Mycena sanguinolenta]